MSTFLIEIRNINAIKIKMSDTDEFMNTLKNQIMTIALINNQGQGSFVNTIKNYFIMFIINYLFKNAQEYINIIKRKIIKQKNEIRLKNDDLTCIFYKNSQLKYLNTGDSEYVGNEDVMLSYHISTGGGILYYTLNSYKLSTKDMSDYIEKLRNIYLKENKINYYYSMIKTRVINKYDKNDKNYNFINKYSQCEITSNKTFDNLFGSHIKFARSKLDFFLNNKSFYDRLGNPYTIGFLLYGPPGTGKTSFIKAIANSTKKSIINVDLKNISKMSLSNIFMNNYFGDEYMSAGHNIDIKNCIIILEDVDCLGSVVLDRNLKDQIISEDYDNSEKDPEKLDLNFLLNLLDGVAEAPGRIIIMTTNCVDKLDKALVRPGRIDYKIKFDYCDNQTISEIYYNFYTINQEFAGFGPNECQVLPLTINQILCSNIDNPENAFIEINGLKSPKDFEIVKE